MKKFLTIAAMAATLVAFSSCTKDGGDSEKDQDTYPVIERAYRMASLDGTKFTYDAEGRVASFGAKQFSYSGSELTISEDGTVLYKMTLNEDGFATAATDGDANTYEMSYDKHGYLISAKKNGEEVTEQEIDDNGNIEWWGRWDATNNFWRMKEAEYLSDKNLGCVQSHWAEDAKFDRWVWESRLLGNTSVYLMHACTWHNFDGMASKAAVYTYEFDKNGLVTSESKYYGVWDETAQQMDGVDLSEHEIDTKKEFTWEAIK